MALISSNDAEFLERIRATLSTAVIGDVLDVMGYRHQFLPPNFTPLRPDAKIVGRAMPVQEADSCADGSEGNHGPLSSIPFGLMIEALDSLQENEIYIATGSHNDYAMWGGLMSTRAAYLKAAGAILDGFIRDTKDIERLGFPVFSKGLYAQDQGARGKVIDYRCPVVIGGIRITPGDLIFADREGVLIIPRSAEEEAIKRATEKASAENKAEAALKGGMSVRELFDTFNVL